MHLTIGQEYYMEALHKAGLGVDHLSVGVTLPSGKNEWPIPKKYIRYRPHQGMVLILSHKGDGLTKELLIQCKTIGITNIFQCSTSNILVHFNYSVT